MRVAARYLRFAVHFTPQYGDSLVECLRLEMLLKGLTFDDTAASTGSTATKSHSGSSAGSSSRSSAITIGGTAQVPSSGESASDRYGSGVARYYHPSQHHSDYSSRSECSTSRSGPDTAGVTGSDVNSSRRASTRDDTPSPTVNTPTLTELHSARLSKVRDSLAAVMPAVPQLGAPPTRGSLPLKGSTGTGVPYLQVRLGLDAKFVRLIHIKSDLTTVCILPLD